MHVTGVPESFTIQPLEASLAKNLIVSRTLSRYFKILAEPERRTLYDLHTLMYACMHAGNILVRILSSQTVLQGGL